MTGVGSITYLYVKNPTDSENVRNSKVCVNLNIIRNDCIDSQGQGLKDTIGYSTLIQALYVSFTLTIHSSGNKKHIVLQYLCTKMLVLPSWHVVFDAGRVVIVIYVILFSYFLSYPLMSWTSWDCDNVHALIFCWHQHK